MDAPVLPGLELASLVGLITQFFFLTLRIGAFLLAGPAFGGRYVPLPVRIMATVVMTLPLIGKVEVPSVEAMSQLSILPVMAAELAIGITAGLCLTILFGAAMVAGDRIANTAGLGFASQFDPASGGSTPVIAQLFNLFLLLVFIGSDGHLTAFRIILDSYQMLPPGQLIAPEALVAAGLTAGGRMFALGLQIMLPVVSVLLLLNVVLGVVTRSAPQLNIFSFGFPVTMTATIILLYLTTTGTGTAFDFLIEEGLTLVADTLTEATLGRE